MKKKNPPKNDTQNRRVQEIKYTTIIIIMNVNYNEEEWTNKKNNASVVTL